MSSFKIITDSCADLCPEMIAALDVSSIPLTVLFRGENRNDCVDESIKEVYDGLRKGEVATTAAANPVGWAGVMEPVLQAGQDVLVLAFSSGLSTTYQSAVIAADEMAEKYPERKILVVDTLCASLGQGLLVWYACRKRDEGMTLEQLHSWVEENKLHVCHWFTVDDLMYLKRGGRVSATTALVGTMLQIKPVLHMDDEGHLIKVGTVRGRKASLAALADKLIETAEDPENGTFFISHGDCAEDAQTLCDMIAARGGNNVEIITHVGTVIGAHSGPGTMALFFVAKQR